MYSKKYLIYIVFLGWMVMSNRTYAQQADTLSLQGAIDAALQHNRLLNIKKLQVEERKAKVKEDEVKKYPSVTLNSTYQYNVNVGELVVPAGSFGSLPLSPTNVISLPKESESFELGQHNNLNAGVTIYQPLTQQGKIRTGVNISKTDVLITEQERDKATQQIRQSVEKLYYGLLINQKQKEEATTKLELAKIKLHDVESALLAGKTVDANKAGLQANVADEEQNLLKLDILAQDYTVDLKRLTGLSADRFLLANVDRSTIAAPKMEESKSIAASKNVDLKIANLNEAKSELGIKAAKQSYLPDVGLIAGYTYQKGSAIYPKNNPFAGINFKWNLQDVLSNRQVLKQRTLLSEQAKENVANTEEQLNSDIEKAHRRIAQAESLIQVAQKAVLYRREDLKIQMDRSAAGLNTKTDVLNAQSSLAKSEADLYAAQLSYRLAVSDLKILTGEF